MNTVLRICLLYEPAELMIFGIPFSKIFTLLMMKEPNNVHTSGSTAWITAGSTLRLLPDPAVGFPIRCCPSLWDNETLEKHS